MQLELDFILPAAMPWIWVAVIIVCSIIEASTLSLTTIWAAIAAVPLVFLSRSVLSLKWQLLIFASLTLVLLISTRPLALKYLKKKKDGETRLNSLEGQEVTVTKNISPSSKGEVKAQNGVTWNAKSSDESEIPAGSVCIVTRVEGNTLTVELKK